MLTYKKFIELLTPKEQRQVPKLLFLIFIGMLFEILGIGLVIPALALMTQNNLIERHPALDPLLGFIGYPNQVQLVVDAMLALLGLYVFKAGFSMFMLFKQNKFTSSLQVSLSNRLFAGYLNQPWSFHLQHNSAQLIQNVTSEVNLFSNSALQSGMVLITEGFVLFGIVVLLMIIEPIGAPLVIGAFGFAAWASQRSIRSYLVRLGESRQYHDGMRLQHLQQGIGGAKDVRILGRELDFLAQHNVHNEGSAHATRIQKTLLDLPRLWLELLAVGGLVMLVLVLLSQGTALDKLLPVLGLFSVAAFRIAPSANRILGALQNLRYSFPVVNTLHQELQLLNSTPLPQRHALLPFRQDIQLENIAYRYSNAEHQALNNICLTIPFGTSVGFIGTSGAGKSTLVDVILGLLLPENGQVKVDGINIQSNMRGWQDQIGYVGQSIFLTDETLRRNIAFGLPDDLINDISVMKAIKSAQLEDFVSNLPQGMETFVGERGVRLSGGQRQRIGVARALYHDPAVLVLDEATSALDMATEKSLMEAINALHGDKTLLIIAHRLSTVANCDWVYKMEEGSVIDAGRFEVLINK
jgi:ATP-binding cassette, subfamily B, bacterial PglK